MEVIKTVQDFSKWKQEGRRISMLTCYDAVFASLLNTSPVSCLLVGDSVSMVVHGQDSTIHATADLMSLHIRAVRQGAPDKFIVGDMPFLTHRKGKTAALEAAGALMQAGASAVKLEGCRGHKETIAYLVESGIPVMGHLGLTPQSLHTLGGHKVQGRQEEAGEAIYNQALSLQEAGCFALVMECVPAELGARIARALDIAVIGIGAGKEVDGQVLVLHDALGFTTGFKPRFVRNFLNGAALVSQAVEEFHTAVSESDYPSSRECYVS